MWSGYPALTQSVDIGKVEALVLNEMKSKGIPGLAFAVIRNNEVVLMQTYGYASLDHLAPVTSETVFPIASVDKQIIATCIMMLVEQGKLNVDDYITAYLDSVPASWKPVRIRHLLTHTSGLADDPLENTGTRGYDRYSTEDIFNHIRKQDLVHPVGQKFLYSDAGFFLLQMIFEKASGLSYPAFVQEKIFGPLGMTNTRILDPTQVVPGRAVSYYRTGAGTLFINNFRQISVGPHFGDIGTSIEDLARYDIAISSNRLLRKESYQMMWTRATVAAHRKVSHLVDEGDLFDAEASYGFGWERARFRGVEAVYHSGFTGTSIMRFPEKKLSVVLLTNLTYRPVFRPNALARKIASFYLDEEVPDEAMRLKENEAGHFETMLRNLHREQVDSAAFEPSFLPLLRAALPDYQQKISRYGGLKRLVYSHSVQDAGRNVAVFQGDYEKDQLFYRLTLTAEGKIDLISIE